MINLKGRLLKIASMATGCENPADIGTDHAYIPIYLIQAGLCQKAVATDIRKGPLHKAARNIEKYRMQDKIELRLGDGIKPVSEGECDLFIISGMGGVLISDILEASFDVVKKAKSIILQPVYTEEVLREYLFQKGFGIETEALVQDEGRIYVIIKAFYDGVYRKEPKIFYHIGRALIENKDPLLKVFLEKRIKRQIKIVNGMSKSHKPEQSTFQEERQLLVQMKKLYDMIGEDKSVRGVNT